MKKIVYILVFLLFLNCCGCNKDVVSSVNNGTTSEDSYSSSVTQDSSTQNEENSGDKMSKPQPSEYQSSQQSGNSGRLESDDYIDGYEEIPNIDGPLTEIVTPEGPQANDNASLLDRVDKKEIPQQKMGKTLVWHEEFDKGFTDFNTWKFSRTMSIWGREYENKEKYCKTVNGNLELKVYKSEIEGKNYATCEGLTTKGSMNFKYGYLEMRARLPYRHGAWPSFWLKADTVFQKASWMCETDIFEVFSSSDTVNCNLHKWDFKTGKHVQLSSVSGVKKLYYKFPNPLNLINEYHVYGYGWDEKEMRFYIDDQLYRTIPIDEENGNFGSDVIDGVEGFHDFQYICINNEVFTKGSGWDPPGWILTDEDKMPIEYDIDWIRLYQDPKTDQIKFADDIAAAKK